MKGYYFVCTLYSHAFTQPKLFYLAVMNNADTIYEWSLTALLLLLSTTHIFSPFHFQHAAASATAWPAILIGFLPGRPTDWDGLPSRYLKCGKNWGVQGLAKRWSPGCVNAAGKARQKWEATAANKFTKPGHSLLAEPCRELGSFGTGCPRQILVIHLSLALWPCFKPKW